MYESERLLISKSILKKQKILQINPKLNEKRGIDTIKNTSDERTIQ